MSATDMYLRAEALEQQRDELFYYLMAGNHEHGDWADCDRLSNELRAHLLDGLDAYMAATMTADPERAAELNERANDILGFSLRGRADAGDLAELERSAAALNAENEADAQLVVIDHAALEAWEQSQENPPY